MSETTIDPDDTLRTLVREPPTYASVFESFDIDIAVAATRAS